MKLTRIAPTTFLALTIGVLAYVPVAGAQTVTTTTKTTTYSGVVSDIDSSASTIILKSETSPTPEMYSYTKETSFVDESGNVVSYETIRNAPVRVEYEMEGPRKIVRRVIRTGPAVVVTPPAMVVPPAVQPDAGTIIREKSTTRTETED